MNLLRIIESTLPVELASTLEAHAAQCRVDGWSVETFYVPRRDPKNNGLGVVDIAHDIIWPWLESNPERPHVMVIGDVPIPRSGLNLNPDGHSDTTGAYPCPTYWAGGTPLGWTDTGENSGFPSKPIFEHVAGDYIWDQNILPVSARCAVGILNLFAASKNRAWEFDGPQSTWLCQAYQRYFDGLMRWKQSAIRPKATFGHGSYQAFNQAWLSSTDTNQPCFKNSDGSKALAPFGALYDFKALPPSGTFWYTRHEPVAAVYLSYESYQTLGDATRNINPLMTGSVAAFPVGFEIDMSGWQTKTIGELWQQSATQGRKAWIALYGDPTFKLPSSTQ
jgi:hypothetical protein